MNLRNPNFTLVRCKDIVCSDIDGEIIMLSVENGKYYSLDAVGSQIWHLLAQPIKLSTLCSHLTDMFDVDRETCTNDVSELLTELANEKLISVQA